MNKFDRIQQLHSIFTIRRTPISLNDLMDRMECKEATVKRLIAKFRHEFGAPILYDREHNGYILDNRKDAKYELPGLWFTVPELHALLTIQEMLDTLQPGILKEGLAPFRHRIKEILSIKGAAGEIDLCQRIRIINVAGRMMVPEHFAESAAATLSRKRLQIHYRSRSKNLLTDRVISPQRLIYYRENWYLDGWCHLNRAIRTFSLDRIEKIEPRRLRKVLKVQ